MSAPKDPEKYEEWKRKISASLLGNQYAKGYRFSEEARQKLSANRKGKPGNKDLRHTDVSKAQMSVSSKNAWTAERRAEMSEKLRENKYTLGYKHSDETRQRMSESHKGKKRPEIGKKISESLRQAFAGPNGDELRRKRSEQTKRWFAGLTEEQKAVWISTVSNALQGAFTADVRGKISLGQKKFWDSLSKEQRIEATKLQIKAMLTKRPASPTGIELKVRSVLSELNIHFEPEKPLGRFVIDAFLPEYGICVEADGTYWHSLPGAVEDDARRDAWLLSQGYGVVRLKEEDINAGAYSCVIAGLLSAGIDLGGEIGMEISV